MSRTLDVDLCVIGAGSGGLSVAAGASQLGQRVVLVERGPMGGDCLNFGCVPSKALIAAGRAAHAARHAGRFGVHAGEVRVDMNAVRDHVAGVIAAIAPADSVARFEGLGVTVIREHARFSGPDSVVAGDATIRARRFVIATLSATALMRSGSATDVPPYFWTIRATGTEPYARQSTFVSRFARSATPKSRRKRGMEVVRGGAFRRL